jgi:hypothetical protein
MKPRQSVARCCCPGEPNQVPPLKERPTAGALAIPPLLKPGPTTPGGPGQPGGIMPTATARATAITWSPVLGLGVARAQAKALLLQPAVAQTLTMPTARAQAVAELVHQKRRVGTARAEAKAISWSPVLSLTTARAQAIAAILHGGNRAKLPTAIAQAVALRPNNDIRTVPTARARAKAIPLPAPDKTAPMPTARAQAKAIRPIISRDDSQFLTMPTARAQAKAIAFTLDRVVLMPKAIAQAKAKLLPGIGTHRVLTMPLARAEAIAIPPLIQPSGGPPCEGGFDPPFTGKHEVLYADEDAVGDLVAIGSLLGTVFEHDGFRPQDDGRGITAFTFAHDGFISAEHYVRKNVGQLVNITRDFTISVWAIDRSVNVTARSHEALSDEFSLEVDRGVGIAAGTTVRGAYLSLTCEQNDDEIITDAVQVFDPVLGILRWNWQTRTVTIDKYTEVGHQQKSKVFPTHAQQLANDRLIVTSDFIAVWDQLAIWARRLDDTELDDIWNNGDGTTILPGP